MFNNIKEQTFKAAGGAMAFGMQAGKNIGDFASKSGEAAKSSAAAAKVNSPITGSLKEDCEKAARILEQFIIKEEIENGFDTVIPVSVIKEAKGLAIFTVVKAGFLWSGRAGSGVVVARLPNGGWSAPTAIAVGGAGFGAQVGADITDFVLILNSEEAVEEFSKGGNVTFGGNLQISAGPIGTGAEASVAPNVKNRKVVPVFSYIKSRGLFAGMSIEGTAIFELSKSNTAYYGRPIKASDILNGQVEPPKDCEVLYAMIKKAESRDPF